MMKYSFIVPVINTGSELEKLLHSVPAEVAPETMMVINNSEGRDLTVAAAVSRLTPENYPNLAGTRIIIHDEHANMGCAASWNFGMQHTSGPWIISNSDIVINSAKAVTDVLAALENHEFVIAGGLSFFGMTQACIDLAGTFDENFWPAYDEDLDYVTRISLLDGRITEVGVDITHEHSSALRHDIRLRQLINYTHGLNDRYFITKWGAKIHREFVGPHVYGSFNTPFNNPQNKVSEWVKNETFIYMKKTFWLRIKGV